MNAEPFNSNDELVGCFLEHVVRLAPGDVDGAVQTWREAQREAQRTADGWVAAEEAAVEALMRTQRGEVAWTLQERVHAMFQRAAWRRFRPAGFAALRSAVTAEYLIGTAAVALLVADALPARHLARLYAPFVSVVPLAELGRAPRRPEVPNRPNGPNTPSVPSPSATSGSGDGSGADVDTSVIPAP